MPAARPKSLATIATLSLACIRMSRGSSLPGDRLGAVRSVMATLFYPCCAGSISPNGDLRSLVFGRQVRTVARRDAVGAEPAVAFGWLACGNSSIERLDFLRKASDEVFIGRRGSPALLCADLLNHVDVAKLLIDGIIGLHCRIRVDIAESAMIIRHYLQPVVNPTHDDL